MVAQINGDAPPFSLLEDPEIHFVRYQFLDLSGLLQERLVTKHHALKLTQEQRGLKIDARAHLGQVSWRELPPSFGPGSAVVLYPDWTSARILRPGHIGVLCDASEELCGYTDIDYSKPFERCSRTLLLNVLNRFKQQWHIEFLVGFELEFHLLKPDEVGTPRAASLWSYNALCSSHRGNLGSCVEACVDKLESSGIAVQQAHAEEGESQFEITLDPLPPCTAIDTMLQAREVIKWAAVEHGLVATFAPRPFELGIANGLHMHLSYSERGSPPSDLGFRSKFMAGILNRLPLLCLFGMASESSYSRTGDGRGAGPSVAWGTLNRGCPIRQIEPHHWEFRFIDNTSDVYLTLAAILAAAANGIKGGEALELKDNRQRPSWLSSKDREELGIKTAMPKSLDETIGIAERGWQGLDRYLNTKILDVYLISEKSHLKKMRQTSSEDRANYYTALY